MCGSLLKLKQQKVSLQSSMRPFFPHQTTKTTSVVCYICVMIDYDIPKAYRVTSVTSLMADKASRSQTDRDIRRQNPRGRHRNKPKGGNSLHHQISTKHINNKSNQKKSPFFLFPSNCKDACEYTYAGNHVSAYTYTLNPRYTHTHQRRVVRISKVSVYEAGG